MTSGPGIFPLVFGSASRIRTGDLQVMSLTSYRTALSRIKFTRGPDRDFADILSDRALSHGLAPLENSQFWCMTDSMTRKSHIVNQLHVIFPSIHLPIQLVPGHEEAISTPPFRA